MKKLIPFFFLCIASVINVNAQAPSWEWATSPSGTGYLETHAVAVDDSGNVYNAGYYYNTTATFGSITLSNAGQDDIYVVKYDSTGNVIWARGLGGPDYDEARGIAVDGYGNVYVTGIYDGPTLTFGSSTITNAGSGDMFLLKYDAAGNELWAVDAGGIDKEFGEGVAVDYAGNIYVTGSFKSPTINFDAIVLTNAGDEDIYLVKYDPAGNALWAKSGNGTQLEWATCVAADPLGNVIIGGPFYSDTIFFDGYPVVNPVSNESIFMVKFDSTGIVQWTQTASSNSYFNEVYSIASDAFGNFFVVATVNGDTAYFDSMSLVAPFAGYWDMVVAKYNSAGNILWAKKCGGWGTEYGYSVAADASGNAYVAGYFDSDTLHFDSVNFVTINPNFYSDMFIVKYDPDGNVAWSKSTSGINQTVSYGNACEDIAVDRFANVYTVGSFIYDSLLFDADTLFLLGNSQNVFLAKLNDAGPCSAAFALFPDSSTQHLYWVLNQATGVAPLSYLWEWGDGNSDATAYPSHTYAVGGFYPICCTITDAMGCTNTVCHTMQLQRMAYSETLNTIVQVNVVASIPTNVKQQFSDHEFQIYPNPTAGLFMISCEGFEFGDIKIINAMGAEVFTGKLNSDQKSSVAIDLSDQPSGIYIVIIHHSIGVAVQKLMMN